MTGQARPEVRVQRGEEKTLMEGRRERPTSVEGWIKCKGGRLLSDSFFFLRQMFDERNRKEGDGDFSSGKREEKARRSVKSKQRKPTLSRSGLPLRH